MRTTLSPQLASIAHTSSSIYRLHHLHLYRDNSYFFSKIEYSAELSCATTPFSLPNPRAWQKMRWISNILFTISTTLHGWGERKMQTQHVPVLVCVWCWTASPVLEMCITARIPSKLDKHVRRLHVRNSVFFLARHSFDHHRIYIHTCPVCKVLTHNKGINYPHPLLNMKGDDDFERNLRTTLIYSNTWFDNERLRLWTDIHIE